VPNGSNRKDLPRTLLETIQPLGITVQGCSAIQASRPPNPPQSRSTIRLWMLIGRELKDRGIITSIEIGVTW
jgi:hypothetical protein